MTSVMKPLLIGILLILMMVGFVTPADSTPFPMYRWELIQCEPDGNNSSVTATLINNKVMIHDAVCEDDTHDWYLLPLTGDVTWEGGIHCETDGPGLRVAVYADVGTGLQLLQEGSPQELVEGDNVRYALPWNIADLASGMGMDAAPAGVYYIRVTYYTYHPGIHPYMLSLNITPSDFTLPTYTTSNAARQIPPGISHHGHLSVAIPNNWFTFTIGPGQTGSGIIYLKNLSTRSMDEGKPHGMTDVEMKIRDSNLNVLGTTVITYSHVGYLDSVDLSTLQPGSYFIELSKPSETNSSSWQAYYRLFNHALAPDTGDWGPDANNDIQSAVQLTDGVPVAMALYNPRDTFDFFKFSTQGYYLGDIIIEPSLEMINFAGSITNNAGAYQNAAPLPGRGITNRYNPLNAGDYVLQIFDNFKMYSPIQYTITYHEHGEPISGAVHDTKETAKVLPAGEATPYHIYGESAVADFAPGIQDVYFLKMEVPSGDILAGYFEIKGSRPDYQVQFGKDNQGSVAWSPVLTPNTYGRLYVDLNYEFTAGPGVYYIKVKMLQSSPGRMRVFLDNRSRIASCEADDNNIWEDAMNLKSIKVGSNYHMFGDLCPTVDWQDMFFFNSDDFEYSDGPRQYLRLKGSKKGMILLLASDEAYGTLGKVEVTEDGGTAIIDLDGIINPGEKYWVAVGVGVAPEDDIQVYDLDLCPDFQVLYHPEWILKKKLNIKVPLRHFELEDDD